METVVNVGKELISDKHFAVDKIKYILYWQLSDVFLWHYYRDACQELEALWEKLEALSSNKNDKLNQAFDQQKFDREVKDAELWLEEVEKQLQTEDLGKVIE